MISLLVIGIGSPFGADRVGWAVVEQLQQRRFAERCQPVAVTLRCCASPAQLPGVLEHADAAVVVDAVAGAPCGSVCCLDRDALQRQAAVRSSHGIGVREALQLSEQLFGSLTATALIGVGIGAAPGGDGSPSAQTIIDVEQSLLAFIHSQPGH